MIVDECLQFMFASTQTTSSVITNCLYYLTMNSGLIDQVKKELQKEFNIKSNQDVDWTQILNYDTLNNLNYLQYCVNETMRIEPSVQLSSTNMVTEQIEVCGYKIRSDHSFQINMMALHHNKQEWITPEKFIPDRFDPSSSYYLRPDGKKRSPFSFGPFLGGKRICLGKTFAENIAKSVLAIIISQFDFKFCDPSHYDRKPANTLHHREPIINVKVSKAK